MNPMKKWLTPLVAGLFLTFGVAQAQAAPDSYPADPAQRNFDSGPSGYTDESSQDGICLLTLTCPSIENTYESDADGTYARTTLGSLTGLQATSISTFTSSAFTYRGAGGEPPKKLALRMVRRADVDAFVAADNNTATYGVDLVNVSGGRNVKVFNRRALAGFDDFAEIPPESIDPGELEIGDRYKIAVTARFESGVQVVPGATADFDSIRLEAVNANDGSASDGSGGNGGNGSGNGGNGSGNGGNGGNGANGGNGLEAGGKATIAGSAVLKGSKLLVKVRCAKKPKKRCVTRVSGLLKKKGPKVTKARTVRVKPGKTKRVALRIKPKFLARATTSKKLVIKQKTKRAGKKKAKTTYKKVRIS